MNCSFCSAFKKGKAALQEAQGCTAEDVSEDGDALHRAQLRPAVQQLFEHAQRGLPLRMRPALHKGAVRLHIIAILQTYSITINVNE